MPKRDPSRREFLKRTAASTLAVGAAPTILLGGEGPAASARPAPPMAANDAVQVGLIGAGLRGFHDARTAAAMDGVELVAVADCYDGRLARAGEVFGDQVMTTRDYREVLSRSGVDAVIVATPDHWHAQIAQDALAAGKHVYLEKPMVHDLDEGHAVIDAQKQAGRIVQVGSQRVSSIMYEKAKQLYEEGAIGTLNMVQARYNRNSALGAWQYSIPPDASPETVAWEQFLGDAPDRPFDLERFFRWRNYWDYGTGVAGDLFVHLYSGIHYVLDAKGPTQVMASGGLRHWQDGRDVPDVQMGLYEYAATERHPDFTLALQVNFADGGGGGQDFQFVGDEGMITIGYNQVSVSKLPPRDEAPGYTVDTFAEKVQDEFLKDYRARYPEPERPQIEQSSEVVYQAPGGYDDDVSHFENFFQAIREDGAVTEDATFGFRAAAPALLTNLSYRDKRAYRWDPEAMELVS